MATTASRTRKTAAADKAPAPKRTIKRAAAKKSAPAELPQKSVTGTFVRGKRDKNGVIQPNEPTGQGGVRFEDEAAKKSPVYVTQADDKAMGSPAKIRVTVTALA